MKYDPKIHHRRSIRLAGYDYSQPGLYFITICTRNRLCLFGNITNDEMIMNDAGRMVHKTWANLLRRFTGIQLNEHIIMPNHFHGIIVGVPLRDVIQNKVGDMVGAFKSITTNEYIRGVKTKNWPQFNKKLWQRNYYEHIIRNEESYQQISEYIQNNPLTWHEDKYYG